MAIINDPTTGQAAQVETVHGGLGQIRTDPRTTSEVAVDNGLGFVVQAAVAPTGASDFFVDIKNLGGSPYRLRVTHINARVATATTILTMSVGAVVNTSSDSPTAATILAKSSNPVSITSFVTAETDPDLSTLDTTLTPVCEFLLDTVDTDRWFAIPGGILVHPGAMFAIQSSSAGNDQVDCDIHFQLER